MRLTRLYIVGIVVGSGSEREVTLFVRQLGWDYQYCVGKSMRVLTVVGTVRYPS